MTKYVQNFDVYFEAETEEDADHVTTEILSSIINLPDVTDVHFEPMEEL